MSGDHNQYQKPELKPGEWVDLHGNTKPLYTAPPQREWVGLTEEEINEVRDEVSTKERNLLITPRFMFARAIEAKLKEKNT